MAGNGTKRKRGRPPKPIDYPQVYRLAKIQCTDIEIASCIDFNIETFRKRKKSDEELLTALNTGREVGKKSLRRKLYHIAVGGNVRALTWLSMQYLDMHNVSKGEVRQDVKVEGEVQVTHDLSAIKKMTTEEVDAHYHEHIAGRNGRFN